MNKYRIFITLSSVSARLHSGTEYVSTTIEYRSLVNHQTFCHVTPGLGHFAFQKMDVFKDFHKKHIRMTLFGITIYVSFFGCTLGKQNYIMLNYIQACECSKSGYLKCLHVDNYMRCTSLQ